MTHPRGAGGPPTFADPAEAAAYAQYRDAQQVEYNTWVAAADIFVGNVCGYRVGHPVPKSVVEERGWDKEGLVVPAGGPLPEAGVDREQQLKDRMDALEKERAAIAAELAPKKATKAAPAKAKEEQA